MSDDLYTTPFVLAARLSAFVVFALVLTRFPLYGWKAADRPVELREYTWWWWKLAILALSVAVVFLFTPVSFLNRMGYWEYIAQGVGSVLLYFSGICFLTGLEVSLSQGRRGLLVYAAIFPVALLYFFANGAWS